LAAGFEVGNGEVEVGRPEPTERPEGEEEVFSGGVGLGAPDVPLNGDGSGVEYFFEVSEVAEAPFDRAEVGDGTGHDCMEGGVLHDPPRKHKPGGGGGVRGKEGGRRWQVVRESARAGKRVQVRAGAIRPTSSRVGRSE
jgi:hypothetical protein